MTHFCSATFYVPAAFCVPAAFGLRQLSSAHPYSQRCSASTACQWRRCAVSAEEFFNFPPAFASVFPNSHRLQGCIARSQIPPSPRPARCEKSTPALFGRTHSDAPCGGAPCGGALTSAARGRLTPNHRVRKYRSNGILYQLCCSSIKNAGST